MYPEESPNAQIWGCISKCRGFPTLKLAQHHCDTKSACGGVMFNANGNARTPYVCRKAEAQEPSTTYPEGIARGALIYVQGGGGDITYRKEATGFHEDCRTTKGQYIAFSNATVSGLYEVNITIGGVATGGSPYPIYVAPSNLSEPHSSVFGIKTAMEI